ncbi:GLPGLI family protein [Prevotella dentasini]|uniref:GLPGLI family protein n=1 Tax=Prevotella dentasini TaxID=589537 RepID=UPI0004681E74|nr:GLPGLI family protein [Prevotella dentasini]
MKKTLTVLCLLFVTLSLAAQGSRTVSRSIDGKLQGKNIVIDKVQYRITYRTKSVNNTEERDSLGNYDYGMDDMRLDIGSKVSRFYSYTRERFDSILYANMEKGDFDTSPGVSSGSIRWEMYRNYPEGKTSFFDAIFSNRYRIEEPTQQPEWEIVADSSATIMGYPCQMARTNFKGRTWTAWYTEDIPLDFGPWKLCGLPGLILRASDATGQFIFDGVGLQQPKGSFDLIYNGSNDMAERISMKDFVKTAGRITFGDIMAAQGIKMTAENTTISTFDGSEENLDDVLNQKMPYNPIER